MENILGLVIFAVVLSAFLSSAALLFYGYFLAVITTVGLHLYDCFVIYQLGVGSCQVFTDVIDDVAQNMAAVAGAFMLVYMGIGIVKKFVPRL